MSLSATHSPTGNGSSIPPICPPDPERMIGDALAVLVVTTVEGHRVGVPIGVNALEHLRGIVEAGLRVLRQDNENGAND